MIAWQMRIAPRYSEGSLLENQLAAAVFKTSQSRQE
jgi:hypothetical protein